MTDTRHLEVGMRYRRNAAPHDYVWASSQNGGRAVVRTTSGTGYEGMSVEQFKSEFTVAPKGAHADGFDFALKMHTQHTYDPGQIRDAAAFRRELYDTAEERLAFDDGVSAYLFAPRRLALAL